MLMIIARIEFERLTAWLASKIATVDTWGFLLLLQSEYQFEFALR